MSITLIRAGKHLAPGAINAAAAETVLRYARDVDDARFLFEMVGLVADGGRELLPDDTREYDIEMGTKAPAAKDPDPWSPLAFADHGRRPEGMTTPPGLAVLAPTVPAPARPPARKRTPRPQRTTAPAGPVVEVLAGRQRPIKHGTPGGYFAHSKRKVPIPPGDSCGCRAAGSAYFAARKAAS